MDWSKYIVKPLTLSLLTFSLSGCSKNPSPTEITGPGDSISQVSVDGETEQSLPLLNHDCFFNVSLKDISSEQKIDVIVSLDTKLNSVNSVYSCNNIDEFVQSESLGDLTTLSSLVDILGTSWDWDESNSYLQISKQTTQYQLQELSGLKIEMRDQFDPTYLDKYFSLLERDVDPSIISIMNPVYFNEAIRLIDSNVINPMLLPDVTLNLFEYSCAAAQNCPLPRFPLIKKLPKDPMLALLISGYSDYFKVKDNRVKISKLLEEDEAFVFTEFGGNVVSRKEGFEFIQIPDSRIGKVTLTKEDDLSYSLPEFAYRSLGSVGLFHFHASPKDDSRLAGPSGADLFSLKSRLPLNPYIVDCVITKLDEHFVATVYYHETYECEDERFGVCSYYSPSTITLGSYRIEK